MPLRRRELGAGLVLLVLGALLLYGYSGVLTVWSETPCPGHIACQVRFAVSPIDPSVRYVTLLGLVPSAALAGWWLLDQWRSARTRRTRGRSAWVVASGLLIAVTAWSSVLLVLSTLEPGFASVLIPSRDALVLTLYASLLGMPVVTIVAGAGMCGHAALSERGSPM